MAWAICALVLLAIGVRSKSGALRWLSLGMLVLTLGKVLLHDLGELEDLYRVASLVGLALSLIVVSLIYNLNPAERGLYRETDQGIWRFPNNYDDLIVEAVKAAGG